MAVQVTRQDLTNKVQEGWKKKALAEHYGLSVMQMTQLLKDAELTIRKFHAPKYILVDEVAEVAQFSLDANEQVEAMIPVSTVETISESPNFPNVEFEEVAESVTDTHATDGEVAEGPAIAGW